MPDAATPDAKAQPTPFSLRETLTSVMIAFMMAFVFRGFVMEGFLIPTGSMAPTLLGKHMRFNGPDTGYNFAVGPRFYPNASQTPYIRQGKPEDPVTPIDPMTRDITQRSGWTEYDVALRAGDRVFVLKYLPVLFEPARWDVVVFKNPGTQENYIKRLIGLPDEQLALVAGDVFTRPVDPTQEAAGADAWAADNWRIQRKPERVQRSMFQLLFDSIYTPPSASSPGSTYRPPWQGEGGWEGIASSTTYRKTGSGPATLAWRSDRHPIDDWVAYNQSDRDRLEAFRSQIMPRDFPVPDVAMRFGVEPDAGAAPPTITAVLNASGFEFHAVYDSGAGSVSIEMRPQDEPDADWRTLASASGLAELPEGRVTTVEFWHVDQAVSFFIDGDLVAGGPEDGAYELTPAQRMRAATGVELAELLRRSPELRGSILGQDTTYRPTSVRWEFEGGPLTLHRVALLRDIYYQHNFQQPTRAAHPNLPAVLSSTQYFMCGDNSPSSLDSRLWSPAAGAPDPWVADQFDDTLGVVHRDMLIGKAYIVYFPAPLRDTRVPIPDIGRVRWIW